MDINSHSPEIYMKLYNTGVLGSPAYSSIFLLSFCLNPAFLPPFLLTVFFLLSLFSGVIGPFFLITIVKIHRLAVAGARGKITPSLCKHKIKPSLASEGFSVKQVNREIGTR